MRAGRFRADLYYRLHVARLHLPPLRARLDDLPLLVAHALERHAARLGLPAPPAAPAQLLERLARHPWPGNVRELLNAMEALVVRSEGGPLPVAALEGILGHAQRPDGLADAAPWLARERPRDDGGEVDPERIARALRATGGNVSRAARRLGLARSTLRHRIARYGLADLIPRD
jgi:DNA-binding NtrC family response regulator